MAKRTLNVALIGSKFMGKAHSNAWLKVGKFFDLPMTPVLHTLAARNPEETEAFARQWGWDNWTVRWKEAATDPEVDLVDVGTPNHLHADQSIAALEAGKHVACEKPLAGTLDDARRMVQAARKAKAAKTFVWYNYRRLPAVALAHQIVKEGKLGRLYHLRATYLQSWGGPQTPLLWRFQGRQAGSGAHGDLNAHIIDMARFITGDEITEVVGAIEERFIKERELVDATGGKSRGRKTGRSTVDDTVLFLARLSGGAVASFECTRLATGYRNANRFEIHGEKGALRFNLERMNELGFYDATQPERTGGWTKIDVTSGPDGHPYAASWWPPGHGIGYEHGFINQAADIVAVIAGRKPVIPIPDFEDAYQTQRVLHAAIESARNREPVKMSQVR